MIQLRKVTSENLWEVVGLSVKPEQEHFVATNTDSLLEAYVSTAADDIALPFGLYKNEKLIGFVMFGYGSTGDEGEPAVAAGNYCIWRFMIDQEYQGKGYGKKAVEAALQYLESEPAGPASSCWLSYEPENLVAKALYESVGFQENGEMCGDEIVAVRHF